jgi:hypothetical protein
MPEFKTIPDLAAVHKEEPEAARLFHLACTFMRAKGWTVTGYSAQRFDAERRTPSGRMTHSVFVDLDTDERFPNYVGFTVTRHFANGSYEYYDGNADGWEQAAQGIEHATGQPYRDEDVFTYTRVDDDRD